jgi:cyanophycin synthetase
VKIIKTQAISGPNIFNHRSVSIMTIDLEEYVETDSAALPEFSARIQRDLPGLAKHRCSRGYEGGFIERLGIGTYMGHIIEHIALEMSEPSGSSVSYGKTVYGGAYGIYKVVIECSLPSLSRHLLHSAFHYARAALAGEPFDLEKVYADGRKILSRDGLGPSTKAIVAAAQARGIPWSRINNRGLVQLGYGEKRKFIQATQSWNTNSIAVDISCNKALTKDFLSRASIPVPYGRVVETEDEAIEAFQAIREAAVVKPLDGNQGKGVSVNLTTQEQVRAAFRIAQAYSRDVIVEEMFEGQDYRLIVVGGKLVAAARRCAPTVLGDGLHTVRELVEIENLNPLRGDGHEKPMTKMRLDEIAQACLEKQGLAFDHVVPFGRTVLLRESTNLSTGGLAVDVTDEVHPSTALVCERAAAAIGLDICGVDLLASDISKPLTKANGIVELNAAPGIRMHHYPSQGKARDVGGAIVDSLFPSARDARIPIISVTGTNGKTTTTRLTAHIMQGSGKTVGMTTTGGIWLNDVQIAAGDTTGPRSAQTVLGDPSVGVAVLETARGGLARNGLGYDWSDVGIITNIGPDHIGQDGIEDEDDILHIKALVAERVGEGGSVILRADDARLASLPDSRSFKKQKLNRRIVYFSTDAYNETLLRHMSEGGRCYYLHDGLIYEAQGTEYKALIAAACDIPITLNGKAGFQIENVMAAIAAARAQGLGIKVIVERLKSFENGKNQGRMNIFSTDRGSIILDYGHNPNAFGAVGQILEDWQGRRTGIIALPGDRSDAMIRAAAEAAGGVFDRIIIKHDIDPRGRQQGETAAISREAIQRAFPDKECLVVPDEASALKFAVDTMLDNEVIVHFFDDLTTVVRAIEEIGGQARESLAPKSSFVSIESVSTLTSAAAQGRAATGKRA